MRRGRRFFIVLIGGLAAAATGRVLAQNATFGPGLRVSFDGDQDLALPQVPSLPLDIRKKKRPDPRKAGEFPTVPPGSGAGITGFRSDNLRKGKAKRLPGTGQQADPLQITPPTPPSVAPQTPAPAANNAAPNGNQAPSSNLLSLGPVTPGALNRSPLRKKLPSEQPDPFDQIDHRFGAFLVKSAVELTGGYDTNPARVSTAKGSWFETIAPEFMIKSNWSRHEIGATIRGYYMRYEAAPALDRPNLDARVFGRLDITRDTTFNVEGRYLLSTDQAGSPDLPADFVKLPIYTTTGVTGGLTQRLNRFELAVKVSFDRSEYQDAKLTDGSTFSNADRNFDQTAVTVRGSYELTPGVKPFVEATFDERVRDFAIDRSGEQRDSTGTVYRAGSTFEITRILTGEISAGYLVRNYKDPTLSDLRGIVGDASLIWAMTGLTNVKLTASTAAEETTLVGVSGVLRRDVVLTVDHALRRWLIATVRFGYGTDDYQGISRLDSRYFVSAALLYKLNRSLQLKAELREEWLRSNLAGNDYTATVGLIGLRWQP